MFPSIKERSITPRSISRAIRNNSKKKTQGSPKHTPPYGDFFNIEHFTPHDLRRTAASQMTASGIPRLVVSKVLNHAEKGVTAVYDRHSYDEEKRIGLKQWGEKLTKITKKI